MNTRLETMTSLRGHIAFAILWVVLTLPARGGNPVNWEEAPIDYSKREPVRNPVAALQRRIDSGEVKLDFDTNLGYLPAVLRELDIAAESQVLTFAKTSLQRDKIDPEHPRALYFNQQTHVGYVQGGVLEMAVPDADLGMVFYTMDQEEVASPKMILQANRCMACHGAARTGGIPGLLVRSVFPDTTGEPIVAAGSVVVGRKTPIAKRWGGWFVTPEGSNHLGNKTFLSQKQIDQLYSLESMPDRKQVLIDHYLHSHSDALSLMVLEHQAEFYNALTNANFVAQRALWEQQHAVSDATETQTKSSLWQERLCKYVQSMVEILLLKEAIRDPIPADMDSAFVRSFQSAGKSSGEQELRKLEPTGRTFASGASYLLYSPALESQPESLKRELARQWMLALHAEGSLPSHVVDILDSDPPRWLLSTDTHKD